MFSTFYSSIFTNTRVVECLIDRLLRLAVVAQVNLDFFVVYLFGICMIYTIPDVTCTTYLSLLAGSGCIEGRQLVDDYLL